MDVPAVESAKMEQMQERLSSTRITLRPIASPAALGFIGLMGATFVVGGLNLGWIGAGEAELVGLILLAFVAPLQILASVLGYFGRDAAIGTGMGVLSGTWASFGLILLTSKPGSTSDAAGTLFVVSGVAMLVPAAVAFGAKRVPAAVLSLAALRFLTSGIYQLSGSHAWEAITGWVGLLLGAVALYAALAVALEDSKGRTILPTGRLAMGRTAVTGTLTDQLQGIEHEAGVRKQL